MLTGKAKEDFEDWLEWDNSKDEPTEPIWLDTFEVSHNVKINMRTTDYFQQLPFSMQYGVYVDWFDSVSLNINVQPCAFTMGVFWCSILTDDLFSLGEPNVDFKTRHEARQKAIEKANEIYNDEI